MRKGAHKVIKKLLKSDISKATRLHCIYCIILGEGIGVYVSESKMILLSNSPKRALFLSKDDSDIDVIKFENERQERSLLFGFTEIPLHEEIKIKHHLEKHLDFIEFFKYHKE